MGTLFSLLAPFQAEGSWGERPLAGMVFPPHTPMGVGWKQPELMRSLLTAGVAVPFLQLAGGLLSFMVSRGSGRSTSLLLDQLQLSDGKWHDLQLELRDVHSGRDSRYVITLTLDFGLYQVGAA